MLKYMLLVFSVLSASVAFTQSPGKFHKNAIVADTHNDVLSIVVDKGYDFGTDLKGKTHTDLKRLKAGAIDIQVFSIFCDDRYGKGTAFNYAMREIDTLFQLVRRNPQEMQIVHNSSELSAAISGGKIACLTGVEGGHMIEEKLEYLDSFYTRGARYMTLTWNNSVSWASSAADESKGKLPFGMAGLTEFGKQVVRRMNELGMIVDLSHVGEKTFYHALEVSNKPVIASHSSAFTLCPHPRNLKDEQIKAIAKNGGVIFVNFYSGFLDSNYMKGKNTFFKTHQHEVDSLAALNWPGNKVEDFLFVKYSSEVEALRPPLSLLIDHIDYIVKIAGVDHVGLGSDFDGIESAPQGLDGVQDFPKITQALLHRGYKKRAVRKILGGNFLRVFKAVTSFQN